MTVQLLFGASVAFGFVAWAVDAPRRKPWRYATF
jgi:hypothetical protein